MAKRKPLKPQKRIKMKSLTKSVKQIRDSAARKVVREDDERHVLEQGQNTNARKVVRENDERRALEQARDTAAHRVSTA
jgi:hypothetical protein